MLWTVTGVSDNFLIFWAALICQPQNDWDMTMQRQNISSISSIRIRRDGSNICFATEEEGEGIRRRKVTWRARKKRKWWEGGKGRGGPGALVRVPLRVHQWWRGLQGCSASYFQLKTSSHHLAICPLCDTLLVWYFGYFHLSVSIFESLFPLIEIFISSLVKILRKIYAGCLE